jgi:hypothetical protein
MVLRQAPITATAMLSKCRVNLEVGSSLATRMVLTPSCSQSQQAIAQRSSTGTASRSDVASYVPASGRKWPTLFRTPDWAPLCRTAISASPSRFAQAGHPPPWSLPKVPAATTTAVNVHARVCSSLLFSRFLGPYPQQNGRNAKKHIFCT